MNFIIFDLEATCWPEKIGTTPEIIEIGAVKINNKQQIISEFDSFVHPELHPLLSDYCTGLTSIRQQDVDKAEYLPSVIGKFRKWINLEHEEYLLCSWGFYDKKQLIIDCTLHNLEYEWIKKHISLKHQHAKITNQSKPLGLGNALDFEKIKFEGTAHRGIDDAKNIAKIFIKYFAKWNPVSNDIL